MNELGKLLLLLGTGYSGYQGQKRQNKAQEYDWQRQAGIDADNKRMNDIAYQDALNRQNALKDYNTAASTIPGMPGYVPPPGVMGYGQTTMSGGKFGPGSPFGTMPEGYAPGVAPPLFGTEEEAIPALDKAGITNPHAMEYGRRKLREDLPSESEQRQKIQWGREDTEYNRTMTVGGVTFPARLLNQMRIERPELFLTQASPENIQAYNDEAAAYGFPPIQGAITEEDLAQRRDSLKTQVAGQDRQRWLDAPTEGPDAIAGYQRDLKGMPYMAPAIPPLRTQTDLSRPTAPMPERFQTIPGLPGGPPAPAAPAPKAPLPREMRVTPDREPSRMGFFSYLAGQKLSPEAYKIAREQGDAIFDPIDKAAAEANKLVQGYVYIKDNNGSIVRVPMGSEVPASQANTMERESLKALGLPSTIGSREANTAFTTGPKTAQAEANTNYINVKSNNIVWQQGHTEEMDTFNKQHKTDLLTLAQDKFGLDEKEFDEKVRQYDKSYAFALGKEGWDRYTDKADLRQRSAAELRGFIEAALPLINKLIGNNWSEDGKTYTGIPGQQAVVQNKIDSLRAGVTNAYKLYKAQVLTGGGGGGPYIPLTGEPTPTNFTGAPTGLPTIDPKVERTRVYNEAAAAAKLAKIKDATTGKTRSLTPQEQKQLINTIMRNRGLI